MFIGLYVLVSMFIPVTGISRAEDALIQRALRHQPWELKRLIAVLPT